MKHRFLLSFLFSLAAAGYPMAEEAPAPENAEREIPMLEAAWKTALLPAWNSFETGEKAIGIVQSVADAAAVAGITLSLASGGAGADFPIVMAVSLGLAWANRLISMPVNLLSTYQYNSELRAGRAPGPPGSPVGRGGPPDTMRNFGFGFGVGNVNAFARDHAYWVGAFSLQGERLSLTITGRVETPVYDWKAYPGRYTIDVEETSEYALVPEYKRLLPGNWYGKGGMGIAFTRFLVGTFVESDWEGQPLPEMPEWDLVLRIEPVLSVGRAFWDNKLTLEASLGFTAWDSRYTMPRKRDAIPFGWGLPIEPCARIFYWL